MLQIWYPSRIDKTSPMLYITSEKFSAIFKKDLKNRFDPSPAQLAIFDKLKTHTHLNAPIALDHKEYPVILFSPGHGAPVTIYTTLLEELASHGYIVVSINYPYISNPVIFPDGQVINSLSNDELRKIWHVDSDEDVGEQEQALFVSDIQFVLEKLIELNKESLILKHTLDLENIGLVGHSFGGGISINACAIHEQCKAVANIDGRFTYSPRFETGFNKPLLVIRNPFHKKDKKEQLLNYLNKMAGPVTYIEVPEMLHNSFTDVALFISGKTNSQQILNPQKGLRDPRKLLVDFFDSYLKAA